MKSYFSAEFFAGNRARLREQTRDELVVITAAGQMQKSGDTAFPFQQDTNFWYLTGIDEPDAVLVLNGPEEYLILPELTDYQHAFDGSFDNSSLKTRSGIKTILDEEAGWERLSSGLKKAKSLATLMPPDVRLEVYAMYANPARAVLVEKLKSINPKLKFTDLRPQLAYMRMVKQKPELEAIQKAIDITIETIRDAASPAKLAQYKYEYQVEAEISYGFKKRGASLGFDSVVAAGKNATTIHSHDPKSQILRSDLLLMDIGAEVEQYDADITRTVSVNGRPGKRQKEIYNAVLEAQEFGFNLMKPGANIRENEKAMEAFIGQKLRELGLIRTIKRERVRKFYPHALSHSLGLDTHDAADYGRLLEPGMVFTVEPGIYVPEEKIGVRIEDDVLITENGHKILSSALSRELL